MNLNSYMEQGIKSIARTASRFYLKSSSGRHFIAKFIPALQHSAKVRNSYERNGVHIPPFLIASIASQCNLQCAGCYARAGGICADEPKKAEMAVEDWKRIFKEASDLGVSFILLAGGEPLLRRDLIELAAGFSRIAFPIFSNGTLIDEEYMQLFDANRNLIPVLSLEGSPEETDRRRGAGIYQRIENVMGELKQRGILYAASITVTNRNLHDVASEAFVSKLREAGCGVVFYVEYVPVEKGTENLVLSSSDLAWLGSQVARLKHVYNDVILLSFPGDEEHMGGCLAAGRGFFHINPFGGAEPCPFSPYSKLDLKRNTILQVLKAPFFRDVQQVGHSGDEHVGGCTLFHYKDEVERLFRAD